MSVPLALRRDGRDLKATTTASAASRVALCPMRFAPIYQYRPWGGHQLADLLSAPLPTESHVGEAWVLSDRPDHQSRVLDGPLEGWTLRQLMEKFPEQLLGTLAPRFVRFPLLLKFLDAHDLLSVQVHPSDQQANYLPAGESGKTEAWVVLEAGPESRIYAGLQTGTTAESLQLDLTHKALADHLPCFTPKPGDAVFLPAGTVHALGGDVVVFEIQQNSDVTFRLYDWDHVDARTGKLRALQVDQAIACIDFAQGALGPVVPVVEETTPTARERLFECEHFCLWRIHAKSPFTIGAEGAPRVLVCTDGAGQVEHGGGSYALARGDVMVLPAVVGTCLFRPDASVNLLEVALPQAMLKQQSEEQ